MTSATTTATTPQPAGTTTLDDEAPAPSAGPPPLRFEAPGPGSWTFDAEHCERPHSRWIASVLPPIYTEGFRAGMARYGVLLDTIECRTVHGFTFICPRPLGAPPHARKPPPKLVLKVLVRLHPALRRRTRRAAEVLERKLWREDARAFFEELWPQALARFERIQAMDLEALDDDALIEHLEELVAILREQIHDHFARHVAGMLPVGDFLVHAIDWTGCTKEEALALLDGYSPYSIEVMKELDAVTAAMRAAPAALARLQQPGSGAEILEALRSTTGAVGAAVERWLAVVGQRVVTGHDVAELRGLEVPEALVSALRAHLARPPRELQRARVDRATEALRARVPEAHRAQFDELLAEARLVHPLRDGHSVIDFWALGLLRRSLLEAGRRLATRGLLEADDHVVDLEHPEVLAMLRGERGPSADEIAGHVRHRQSYTMEDAPDFLGFPPSPPPPAEWLPAAAARVARAMGLYLDSMFAGEARSRPGATLTGVAASAGTYEGTARLILTPSDFGKVQPGDVLVARITTPSYNILLPMLGAVVTDRGGLLSHPAIVAREYGLPGVVGCREATQRIRDGARVRVDGAAGTVTVLP